MGGVRTRPPAILVALGLPLLAALFWGMLNTPEAPAHGREETPVNDPEMAPLSEATVDDVTIGLLAWRQEPGRTHWTAVVRVSSAADLPVVFDATQIFVTVRSEGGGELSRFPEPVSTLPCSLGSGDQATLSLVFEIAGGESAATITIGILEEHRSGARVVFPLESGGSASAFGGSGARGADAHGGHAGVSATPAPAASPEASPTAEGCPR